MQLITSSKNKKLIDKSSVLKSEWLFSSERIQSFKVPVLVLVAERDQVFFIFSTYILSRNLVNMVLFCPSAEERQRKRERKDEGDESLGYSCIELK